MKGLSALALEWLNEMLGGEDAILPRVQLRESDSTFGKQVRAWTRTNASRPLVAMSLGVGGNQEKRVSREFEEELALRLIDEGCAILLDKGAGEEERDQADAILNAVRQRGSGVVEISAAAEPPGEFPRGCNVIAWHGGIGAWAGLIAAADEYIGYDSVGQHIAAASAVPTIDIFPASASPLFRARWQPTGHSIVRVVVAGPGENAANSSEVDEVMRAHHEIRGAVHLSDRKR